MKAALVAVLAVLTGAGAFAQNTADELVARAQTLDKALKASGALALYQKALALQPDRADIEIAIARQYRFLMADAKNSGEKRALLAEALAHALRAEALAPGDSEAHLAVAITYAKRVPLESSRESVKTSRLLKAEIDRVLALDPDNDTAWHLLGRWSESYAELSPARRAVGELLFGKLPAPSYAEAAKCFERAIAENPRRLMHYIELGRVYAVMGRTADARRFLEKGLSMRNREKDDPDYKARGRQALDALP